MSNLFSVPLLFIILFCVGAYRYFLVPSKKEVNYICMVIILKDFDKDGRQRPNNEPSVHCRKQLLDFKNR